MQDIKDLLVKRGGEILVLLIVTIDITDIIDIINMSPGMALSTPRSTAAILSWPEKVPDDGAANHVFRLFWNVPAGSR